MSKTKLKKIIDNGYDVNISVKDREVLTQLEKLTSTKKETIYKFSFRYWNKNVEIFQQ